MSRPHETRFEDSNYYALWSKNVVGINIRRDDVAKRTFRLFVCERILELYIGDEDHFFGFRLNCFDREIAAEWPHVIQTSPSDR